MHEYSAALHAKFIIFNTKFIVFLTHNSSFTGGSTGAGNAFDGDALTYWDGCCNNYPNQKLIVTLTGSAVGVPVIGYKFYTADGECPVTWTLEVYE